MITTILATVIVLGVLIFVHELGHFVTAKLVDIEVPRFSIGLGPRLWGFRRGETEYVISWLPLGGYVKMAGMEEMEAIEGGKDERAEKTGVAGATDLGLVTETQEERAPGRDFESKSLPARMLVISAGVIMNFLFALAVFAGSALVWGIEIPPEARLPEIGAAEAPAGAEALAGIPEGTRVTAVGDKVVEDWDDLRIALLTTPPGPVTIQLEGAAPVTVEIPKQDSARVALVIATTPTVPAVIGRIIGNSPAKAAGLMPGDRIVSAAGQQVESWPGFVDIIRARPGQQVALTVERDGRMVELQVRPNRRDVPLQEGGTETIGHIGAGPVEVREHPGLLGGLAYGASRTWEITSLVVNFLVDLFTGDASPRSLGGPILIGKMSGEVARAGLEVFLNFLALFSVNLAVLNLLPIPVLDGGHLLFLGVEAVRGRALSYEQRLRFTQVGFVIVVALMVWALANDVLRLFGL